MTLDAYWPCDVMEIDEICEDSRGKTVGSCREEGRKRGEIDKKNILKTNKIKTSTEKLLQKNLAVKKDLLSLQCFR
jgi:hypothetical protein